VSPCVAGPVCADGDGSAERPWTCDYSLATCTTGSGVLGCCYPDSTGTTCGFRTTCIVSLSMRSGDSGGGCWLTEGGSRARLNNRRAASRVCRTRSCASGEFGSLPVVVVVALKKRC